MVTLLPARGAALLLLAVGAAACGKVEAKAPPPMPMLDMPTPPGRLIVPATIPDPTPDPTPAVTPLPVRPTPSPPSARPERPASPTPTPSPEASPTPGMVLQTTGNAQELVQRTESQLTAAEHDLDRVNYKNLNPDARLQYDTARQYIGQARNAIRLKNYVFASQLAEKASVLAGLLVKSQAKGSAAPTSS